MRQRSSSAAAWCEIGVRAGVRHAGEAPRWERCVDHRGESVRDFAAQHFADLNRKTLFIGGAGFDPRSLTVARMLAPIADGRLGGLLIREHRPHPEPKLLERATESLSQFRKLIHDVRVVDVDVFEPDGAVALGRRVVEAARTIDFTSYTDVVLDFSALSIGCSFPLTRFLYEYIESSAPRVNLHAMVTARPTTDDRIVPSPSNVVGPVHGFRGRFDIDETARAARLWIPQLRFGQHGILERLHGYLSPHEVVPVLPFPAYEPRLADRLIEEYAIELGERWRVDFRSIVYADERNPLDFYRTVLRIDDGRHPVFEETGGSLLLLSPVGSKVLALGAMMAAMERDLPVIYVEAHSYSAEFVDSHDTNYSVGDLVHVWLSGEVYPRAVKEVPR
jgi:hypothetical protein